MAKKKYAEAEFKEGLKRTESFGNPGYQRTRPDLDEDYDAQFTQVAEVPMKNGEDNEDRPEQPRGYIPAYDGKGGRMGADHGQQSFFQTMQTRRPKP